MSPISVMHGINRKMLPLRNRILVQTDVENAVPDKLCMVSSIYNKDAERMHALLSHTLLHCVPYH